MITHPGFFWRSPIAAAKIDRRNALATVALLMSGSISPIGAPPPYETLGVAQRDT